MTCGKPLDIAAAASVFGGRPADMALGGKGKKKLLLILLFTVLMAVAVILFLLFRGGSGHAISAYEGTWTQCMENKVFFPESGRGYHTLEINDHSLVFRGRHTDYLRFEGMSTEKFELKPEEFEYYGDSGVKHLDGQRIYVKETDEFLPIVSYKYYYHTIHDLGLGFCTLSNGDTAIRLMTNIQDTEITADGIGVLHSYKSTNNPAEWLYTVDFSR
ncbi:MAG: hypothetical protein IJP92_11875 [Lachnospiraceae bacterium]|nr:hypothetical protein [Lachnospiraceae bacterium]